jgi:hypothetical protein
MPEYKAKTNEITEIKLESGIDRVVWSKGVAAVGGKVGLSIDTHFVGNGSEVKIQLKDANGKSHGDFTEKIAGNKLWAEIVVPEKAEGSLTATVKLPKHSLEMKSNPLVVYPQIKIKNLKWDKPEARRGDILTITADIETVYNGTDAEIEIWEFDTDEAHDFVAKIPVEVKNNKIECKWEFDYKEDTDDILTEEESENGYNHPEYFFRIKVLGVSADSGLLEFKDWIEILVTDTSNKPLSNKQYILHLPDGSKVDGYLDDKGKYKVENISPGVYEIEFPEYE